MKVKNSYDEIIEKYTNNQELQKALGEFIKMRTMIKKPLTDYALELILKKLDRISNKDENKKIAILNQSIEKSWQGIFELKENATSKSKTNTTPNTKEYKEAEIDEKEYGRKLKEAIKNRLNGG